ncbi:hypothetical protein Vadar_031484 [Vaccinium darrowii]|uniref:Uncharacterized protein n=1 Tax=Vaccinium darrowii TaxID=229202 RepID=A0ACB7YJF1_9ERIC|nr:hypothetical protein Vadar_031484 [Vaccinium darrowii]
MASNSTPLNQIETTSSVPDESELDRFAAVANKVADAAGEVIRKYFRKPFDIIDKEDSTPVTIADQETEEAMVSVIQECFPSHAISTTPPGQHPHEHEKKGIMEKIKEKPPSTHDSH